MDDEIRQGEVDQIFLDKGFIVAGGIWGDAQWLRISPNTIISVGGTRDSFEDSDYTSRPCDVSNPTMLHVYVGPPDEDWNGNGYTLETGEAPFQYKSRSEGWGDDSNEDTNYWTSMIFSNVKNLLDFVNVLQHNPSMFEDLHKRKRENNV